MTNPITELHKQAAKEIVNATMGHTLRPKNHDRKRVIAIAFKELLHRYGYFTYSHGVVDIQDVLNVIAALEE